MKDTKTKISISISAKLLTKIQEDIKGNSRNEKVAKCIEKGFEKLTEKENARKLRTT